MKFFAIADTHGSFDFPEIQADCLLLLGDIDKQEIVKIDELYNMPKFAVYGNSDTLHHFAGTSIINIHQKCVEWNGLKLAGFGGIPRYSSKNLFYEFDEEQVSDFLETLQHLDIFLAHSNPMLEFSTDTSDAYRGFYSFTKFIKEKNPNYFLHGHIHKSNSEKVTSTTLVSVYKTFIFEL